MKCLLQPTQIRHVANQWQVWELQLHPTAATCSPGTSDKSPPLDSNRRRGGPWRPGQSKPSAAGSRLSSNGPLCAQQAGPPWPQPVGIGVRPAEEPERRASRAACWHTAPPTGSSLRSRCFCSRAPACSLVVRPDRCSQLSWSSASCSLLPRPCQASPHWMIHQWWRLPSLRGRVSWCLQAMRCCSPCCQLQQLCWRLTGGLNPRGGHPQWQGSHTHPSTPGLWGLPAGAVLWQLRRSGSLCSLAARASLGELGPSIRACSQVTGASLLKLLLRCACLAAQGSLLPLCLSIYPCSLGSSANL